MDIPGHPKWAFRLVTADWRSLTAAGQRRIHTGFPHRGCTARWCVPRPNTTPIGAPHTQFDDRYRGPMTIRITRVTTRGGDKGETSLADASRVPKTHSRIEAIGEVDELNSAIGLASAAVRDDEVDAILGEIQHQLFDLGGDLATPIASERGRLLGEDAVRWLEEVTARYNESLPPLDSFILPGGPNGSAALQLARAIARRAERRVVAIDGDVGEAVRYLNRLSDVLFVLGRAVAQGGEKLWQPHARD